MQKFIILNIIVLLLLTSCLSTDVVEVEMPYDEFIVVQSTLKKDSLFSGVRFTKTLSLNEPYNINNAELNDVTAYLLIDETVTIPLHYSEKGLYLPLYPHTVKGGSLYELFAQHSDTKIYSRTFVPDSIIVKSSKLTSEGFVRSEVKGKENNVYGSIWETFQSYPPISASEFFSIVPSESKDNQFIDVRTTLVPDEYLDRTLYVRIYAFDKFYREYFQSKGNNQSDSLFSNVTSPNWNINSSTPTVIGLFIGMDKSKPLNVSK